MKSLRQLAKELGVSASYLSQVNHGKKKASVKIAKMLTIVNRSVNQTTESVAESTGTPDGIRIRVGAQNAKQIDCH